MDVDSLAFLGLSLYRTCVQSIVRIVGELKLHGSFLGLPKSRSAAL